jgi:hypothetical protein
VISDAGVNEALALASCPVALHAPRPPTHPAQARRAATANQVSVLRPFVLTARHPFDSCSCGNLFASPHKVMTAFDLARIASVVIIILILSFAWAKFGKSAAVKFFALSIFFIFVGVVLLFVTIPYLNVEAVHSLAHALIIAGILALTVDQYVKGRVLHEVSRDVSKYLVGYRLPEEVQDRIRELMQTKWIRRKMEVRVALSRHQDGDRIILDVRTSHEIQNITSLPLDFQDEVMFEKHDRFQILELGCETEDGACSYFLESHEIGPGEVVGGRIKFLGKKVRIPPASETAGISYRFSSRFQLEYPTRHGCTIHFPTPAVGVVFEITDKPVDVSCFFAPAPDQVGHNRWVYKRLFLPGEYVRLSWEQEAAGAREE